MRSYVAYVACGAALLCAPGPATAQAASGAVAERAAAMERFADWVGEWEGTGWALARTGRREAFEIRESVRSKVQGTLLLVEGRGTARDASGEEHVVHDALAVLSYDEETGRYRWWAYDLDGGAVETEMRVTDAGFEWGLTAEPSNVELRFTIRIDGDRWHEVGEVSTDGGRSWRRMLEMTLTRRGPG